MEKIKISEHFAQQIADTLNETDKAAKEAIKKEMGSYNNALEDLHKLRLKYLDLLAREMIDADDYRLKLEEIQSDQRHYTKLLEDAQYKISDAWKVTAQTVLELSKNAKSLWNEGTLEEKLEILKRVCWNPVLEGASLRYDLRKPFATIVEMKENPNWRPHGDRKRPFFEVSNERDLSSQIN